MDTLCGDIGSVFAGKVRPGSGPCAASAEAGRAMSGSKFPISPRSRGLGCDAGGVDPGRGAECVRMVAVPHPVYAAYEGKVVQIAPVVM